MNKIDLEIAAYLDFPSEQVDLGEEPPDPLAKFMSDAQLAGAIGGRSAWQHVENLAAETQDLDKRAIGIIGHPKPRELFKATPSDDLDAEIIPGDTRLEKMESAGDRRKRNLAVWMRGQFALGKSAGELIDYAARHDRATANLLREVAAELGQ